jgi:DNA-directed RNA polymerase specialized sigma24 family protein
MVEVPAAASASDFNTTHWSHVLAARGVGEAARASLEWLCRAYWEPLRRHAQRRGWRDADDCVQDFWLAILERGALTQVDQERGRFRSWLLSSLEHHLADAYDKTQALKRGGGRHLGSLAEAGHLAATTGDDPGLAFDRTWAETLLQRARQRLANEHQDAASRERFAALEGYLDANGSAQDYALVSVRLALTEGAVKVAVHRLRSRFRLALRLEVADTLAQPTEAAIDAELGDLLGALTTAANKSGNQGAGSP